jgi:hypothetical protein
MNAKQRRVERRKTQRMLLALEKTAAASETASRAFRRVQRHLLRLQGAWRKVRALPPTA